MGALSGKGSMAIVARNPADVVAALASLVAGGMCGMVLGGLADDAPAGPPSPPAGAVSAGHDLFGALRGLVGTAALPAAPGVGNRTGLRL